MLSRERGWDKARGVARGEDLTRRVGAKLTDP